MTNGSRANKFGKNLESFVRNSLLDNGYTEVTKKKDKLLIQKHSNTFKEKIFANGVTIGTTIYKTKRIVDFILFNQISWGNTNLKNGLVIECKWQQCPGSIDEKYPFLVLNIFKTGIPTIVLIDGGGYKIGAKEWLERQVNPEKYLIGVFDIKGLQKKINRDFFK